MSRATLNDSSHTHSLQSSGLIPASSHERDAGTCSSRLRGRIGDETSDQSGSVGGSG